MGSTTKFVDLLKNFNVFELGGVEPNPRLETLERGKEICRESDIDVILAVSGGSTIGLFQSCLMCCLSRWRCLGYCFGSINCEESNPGVTVLTLAATSSEMNTNAVITNLKTNEKLGTGSPLMLPKASVLDPTHLSDKICESVLKTCIKYCKTALKTPKTISLSQLAIDVDTNFTQAVII
ncbi:hypothetical protein FACS1894198_2430 [Clostridia bacterium]|nr:hypothetical protein FACS1894198_2430 [Clostridia bacterium]